LALTIAQLIVHRASSAAQGILGTVPMIPFLLFSGGRRKTMSGKTTEMLQTEPIRLDFQSVQQVVATGNDGDRWVTTVREAAHACRSALDQKGWKEEFEAFLSHIHEWAKKHADVVSAAYVGISSEGLTGVIVTKGPEYRLEFDDEVSDLDIELAQRFSNCRADILQTPECDPESRVPYISLHRAVQVYGDQSRA
jgi:hypothetical protein